jgi:hypothetical protein
LIHKLGPHQRANQAQPQQRQGGQVKSIDWPTGSLLWKYSPEPLNVGKEKLGRTLRSLVSYTSTQAVD